MQVYPRKLSASISCSLTSFYIQKRGVKARFRDAAVIKDPHLKMVFRHKGGSALWLMDYAIQS
eukprot:1160959-Pelagomonas_calceolata.AAC.12